MFEHYHHLYEAYALMSNAGLKLKAIPRKNEAPKMAKNDPFHINTRSAISVVTGQSYARDLIQVQLRIHYIDRLSYDDSSLRAITRH